MRGRHRSSAEIAKHRRQISNLYLQGRLQAEIASELNLSQSTVSRDLKALRGEWLVSSLMDFDEARANELAKIDTLEREYWDAWQRSREDAETITTKGRGDKETAVSMEKTVQLKGQVGDAAFLRGIEWCIDRRCKLLGLDDTQKLDIVSGGVPIVFEVKGIDLENDI